MPIDRHAAPWLGARAAAALILVAMLALAQTGCTRDDVASAISGLAADLRATVEPLRATAQAAAVAQASSSPSSATTTPSATPPALATARPPEASPTPNSLLAAAGTAFAVTPPTLPPSLTDTVANAETPSPVPSPTSSAPTPTPSPTPPPTPLPLPVLVTVDGSEMALVNGGFFQMGASADDLLAACEAFGAACDRAWFLASEPKHAVLLAPYYMDRYEVTNEAFVRYLNETAADPAACSGQPCIDLNETQIEQVGGVYSVRSDLARRPAAGVTWYGAEGYCAWRGARLPSEAEWERAAGWDETASVARRYPWGDEFHGQRLNFCDANCDAPQANLAWNDGYGATALVALYEDGRSATGLYDMAGNVWEWTADWFDPAYYTTSPGTDPLGPLSGEEKVVRGGSWYDTGFFTMVAVRLPSPPGNADMTLGFRCASDIP